jgi:hypothetical protein
MNTKAIPKFADFEVRLASQTLFERYGRLVPLQTADAEILLNPESEDLTNCPVLYWEERGTHFVVFKLAANRYRGQFFYNEAAQYGTGQESFDHLGDCLITLLQVQSDHEQQMKGIRAGMTRMEIEEDSYDGPLVI